MSALDLNASHVSLSDRLQAAVANVFDPFLAFVSVGCAAWAGAGLWMVGVI